MNPSYSDNPFDNIYAAPSTSSGPQPVRPVPQAGGPSAQNLDDLLNPFAVLGLESKPAAPAVGTVNKAPALMSPAPQPTGAGWTSSHVSPQGYANSSQPPVPPQQWASPHSAFQPPSQQAQMMSPVPFGASSPAFLSASPALYVAPSPAYGTYSPASPAFASGPAYQAQSPFQSHPVNYSSKPDVTDADLSLFAAPVVKSPPKPLQATSPAPVPPTNSSGTVSTVSPQANDGWDNDDFGISWEQPKKPEPKVEEEVKASPKAETASSSYRSPAAESNVTGDHKTEGNVLARVSVRTLIVKEWKPTFWIITGGKLMLYRSKEDYLYNPVGVMVKKDVPLRDNLRCSEVTCKPYKGYGDLYHFTLEEMLDYGPSLIAKFASTDVKAIRELRAVVIAHIIAERKRRVGYHTGMRTPPPPQEQRQHDHGAAAQRSRSPEPGNDEDKYQRWGHI